MAVILDTGIVYAYYDRRDAWHGPAVDLLQEEPGELIIPAPVIPEVDHLLGHRLSGEAQRTFYRGIVDGFYFVADLPREGYARVLELNNQFAEIKLGFVDASVVVIAETLVLRRIATTDRRDFGALQESMNLELLPTQIQ
jgi:predicted nucleic acid-binding protein